MDMAEAAETGVEVLEFTLGSETYCVDIRYVEEIVDKGELTEVPNSAPYVEGVMDLRGRTTTIIDPKAVLEIDESGTRDRIIIFDPDEVGSEGAIGWIVDDADRVGQVADDDAEETSVSDDEAINGVIKQGDDFVVFVDPTAIGS